MKNALKELKTGAESKTFKFEEVCPYPFDRSITTVPFPKHFETPKFDKYRGKGDPVSHVKEFYMACQEVAYSDNFLMRLFPKSLGGTALEWFYKIPYGTVSTFAELSEKFVAQYAHNVENELSLLDLCNSKQKGGESLADYLQRWQGLTTRLSYQPPEQHLIKIFINNLHPKLAYHMRMNCIQTYHDIRTKGMDLERGLVEEGTIKHYKESQPDKHNNDRS
jgi:hypothetical protein